MPAELLAAGMLALSWAAMYFVHSTVLLAGAWLFLKCHPRAGHALRETLWKAALVGSIGTASIQMLPAPHGPFGAVTVSLADFSAPASAASPDAAAGARADNREASFSGTHPGGESDIATEGGEILWFAADLRAAGLLPEPNEMAFSGDRRQASSPSDAATAGIWSFPWAVVPVIGMATALAAIALGIARCLWQTWSLRRRLARCSMIDSGPAHRLLDELRRVVPRAPEVRLLSAPDDPEPSAFGVRRWTIVLPARATCDLAEDELRALLAHELAHLVRGDSLWLVISRVVCSCLAFQPLNHLARREWQRAAEYLCDSWAVSRTGTPLALARCLAEVAGWRLSGRASEALLAATGRKSGLAERIERLVEAADLSETWTELRQRRRLLVAVGVLLGLVTWCTPRVQLAVAAPADPQRSATDLGQPQSDAAQVVPREDATENGPDNATPQANGEGRANVAEAANRAASENRRPTAEDGNGGRPSDLRTLLSSLDRDLSDLEGELRELESLLPKEDAPPAMARLTGRLRQEILQLKRRRNALRVVSKKNLSMAFPRK
jgi:Zn-dependent protease with chaperone function